MTMAPILRVLPSTEDITTIVGDSELRHRNLSMCVHIASVGVDTGDVVNMVSALQLVRRTPWGRAEGMGDIKAALVQSGVLTWVSGSWRPNGAEER